MKYELKEISKDNIEKYLNKYNFLHDGLITNINYDVLKSEIEVIIDAYYSEEQGIKDNKIRIRMVFGNVERCNSKELFSWDFINEAYFKYIKIENKEFICFSDNEDNPSVYIVCDSVKYEELK
jgi:hypothetical protein